MTQVTVLSGRDRRRNWSLDDRHRILRAAFAPGAVISEISRQFDIASTMIYKWRRQAVAANRALAFVPAVVAQAGSPPSIVPPEPPRGIALGRKFWLFAGSYRGRLRATKMYSLIVSAKMNNIDPQAWLADVLARIADRPANRLEELLPWNWKTARQLQPDTKAA